MDDDGSAVTNLTRTGKTDEYGPDWSPGGNKIVLSSYRFSEGPAQEYEESAEISVMNANGTGRKNFTDDPAIDLAPAFSPSGARIAFTKATLSREEGEAADIFVVKADGTNERRLTETRAFEFGHDQQPTDGSVAARGILQAQGITTYQYGASSSQTGRRVGSTP